ncbi:MAG: HAD-IC family P-type ATPase, partial [Nanoarchaeota archaeon]|nr:HAD-IC family P-type ATPase [Nanoarchaeota archaeon]
MPYYQKSVNEIYKEYNTSINGLHEKEAKARLKKYGPNKITSEKKISILKLIFDQINDPLIWVLFFAIIISAIIQHYIDVIVIAIIILLNGIFGFTQEYKAEKAIEHLKKLQQHQIDVIRNGKEIRISTELIVPGDILCIEDGDKIPADCRLIETIELKIDEASLTGESHPVSKNINIISKKVSLGDQTNMIFAGTTVIRGRGKAIVVKTAKKTELGRIAKEIESIETEQTPLQKKLKEIGKWLTYIVIGICVSIFILGAIRGFDLVDMFIMSISLAVAAIPEGLPAVVTITLAIGLKKMLKRQALIRRLRSVETLGSVTVICSDKTGTLTKNEMTVTKVFSNFKDYTVTGSGYNDTGEINYKGKKINNDLNNLILTATTCNNASLILGDPTEKALKALAAKAKIEPKDRKSEIPFSSENKYMIVTDKNNITYLKGALEVVLKRCSLIEIDGKVRKLTPQDKKQILAKNIEYSKEALRVLAFAYGKKELIFLGLTGIMDPPREEVHKSITLCKQAGIRIIMITGDHKITAEAVAKQVGIVGKSINGLDLDKLSDKQLQKTVKTTSIYARVDSIHKARILKALQANGEIVAMTGDGVNDAP